jgi:hypothetical protein
LITKSPYVWGGGGGWRGAYRDLVAKPEGNSPLARHKRGWEDNTTMDRQYYDGVWDDLAQIEGKWPALVKMVMNLRVP